MRVFFLFVEVISRFDLLQSVMPNVVGSDEISKKTFGELGGDSLRAQKLQSAVSSCLGVNVPINLLLGQTNLEQVAK